MFTRVPLETYVIQMCHWAVDCAVAAALAVVCIAAAATLLGPVGHCAVYVSHDETAPPHQSMQFFTDLQWRDSIPSANLTWSSMTRRHSLTSKLLQLRLGKPGLSICRVICRFPQLLQNWVSRRAVSSAQVAARTARRCFLVVSKSKTSSRRIPDARSVRRQCDS